MNEAVKTAVTNLIVEPCSAFKERAIKAVDAASESERRLAITMIEDFLQANPDRMSSTLVQALVDLRRVQN